MSEPTKNRRRTAQAAASAAGLLTAGVLGGAVLAGTMSANAATSTTPSATSSSSSSTPDAPPANFPAHGSAAHEDQEKAVTGSNATQAQAAAVKSVGGGTAGAVTTDMTGKGYEVTVTKTDGTSTEVHLDSSFTVMTGGPHGGPGGPGGAPQGAAPSSSSSQG